jgi:hypothetical protein
LKTTRISFLLSMMAIFFAIPACNAIAEKPALTNLRMATDDSGKTSTVSYSPGDAFYAFADLSGLKAGSVVEAKWYVLNAAGVEGNSEINTSDYTYMPGIHFVYFKLTTNDGSDWPGGSYKVVFYLDGVLTGEQTFVVQ